MAVRHIYGRPFGRRGYMKDKLIKDLKALGLGQGDIVFTHSSLSSLGWVEGGPQTVVDAMKETVSKSGTLLFPAFTFDVCVKPPYFFSYRDSRCCVGAIPEFFRTLPGTIRSVHPSHSVSAWGKEAVLMTKEHILDRTPCGEHSPLRMLYQMGGKILMLGCGWRPNTSMHGVEELAGAPYCLTPYEVEYNIKLENGKLITARHRQHHFGRRWIPRYDRLEQVLPQKFVRRGKVLEANAILLDAKGVWETALQAMKKNSYFFVEQNPADQ